MIRALVVCVGLILLLGSCTKKLICPAYQSSFIYDKEELRKKFSYFKEDSTPKIVLTASKNRYLVAVPESYRRKTQRLQTVEMKPVYPVLPDSLKATKEDLSLAEVDITDSTAAAPTDSVYAITKTKEKYNVDQDIYMWYFRDVLVLPDVRAAMETQNKNKKELAAAKKKKKGLFSFLRRKNKADSLATPTTEVVNPSDSSTVTPTKKKGLFGIFGGKKDKTKPTTAPVKKKDDAKKEDDGF